jgi:adenosylcobinamide-phosphate synthase
MFSYPNYLTLPLLACIAVALDCIFGEPKRYHPLVGFGYLATKLEKALNPQHRQASPKQYSLGVLGLTVLIVPFIGLAYWLCHLPFLGYVTNCALLYFALGHKSLHQHARAVSNALSHHDEAAAILATSYMVSRDSSAIEPVPATVESVLENGNDGVFGAIFWFFIAGGVGALAFRLINTMDAMWGYKNQRYYYFGWAAARLDDVINYIPARLTALTYALLGNTRTAIHCWKTQAPLWDSPNAGPVMSAGAGAMNVKLGGAARYHGEWHTRPILGTGNPPEISDIERALRLVRHGVYLWLMIALLTGIAAYA